MLKNNDFMRAFRLEEQYENYRVRKSWGIMMIVTGLSITFTRLIFVVDYWIAKILHLDLDLVFLYLGLIFYLLMILGFFLPFILAVVTYNSTKKIQVEANEISSKKHILYGFVLFFLYFYNFWLLEILFLSINLIFFIQGIVLEDDIINISMRSFLGDGIHLLWIGCSCLICCLLLTRVLEQTKFRELVISGAILLLFSCISIFLGISLSPPPEALEFPMYLVNTIIIAVNFVGCGFYSIQEAYQLLEGRD